MVPIASGNLCNVMSSISPERTTPPLAHVPPLKNAMRRAIVLALADASREFGALFCLEALVLEFQPRAADLMDLWVLFGARGLDDLLNDVTARSEMAHRGHGGQQERTTHVWGGAGGRLQCRPQSLVHYRGICAMGLHPAKPQRISAVLLG